MEKLRLILVVSVFALLSAACGGGGTSTSSNETPAQPVSVSLSELSATVEISTTYQFNATVENADDKTVNWQVNKVTGGNSTVGTISESGLYTAPDQVPSPITVKVTAVAHADATKEASATVTIMSNIVVSISTEEAAVPAGATQQFTARVENAKDTSVMWLINGKMDGDATVGTLDFFSGLYTAPSLPPPGGVVTIMAVSTLDTSKTDSVNVTVQFSNASLSGPYVFSMSGNDQDGPWYGVGRFVADGNGNITDGIEDYQQAGMSSPRTFTGSYEIRPEHVGRVRVTLIVTGPGGTGTGSLRFQLTNAGEGPMMSFDGTMTGSGQIYKQDSTTFSNASMNGSYVMQALGAESSGTTVAAVGVITIDGAGNLTGTQDVNTGTQVLTKMSFNGTYGTDASGRTVVTTVAGSDTSQTAMYLISDDRAVGVLLGAGSGGGLIWMEKQQLTTFSDTSFSGDYVYSMMGDPAVNPRFLLGRLTVDGAGTISAGVADQNKGGIVGQNMPIAGSYSIPPTDHGRGTVNITTAAEGTGGSVIYLVSDKKAFIIGTDPGEANGGQIVAQEGGPFSTSSLQGTLVHSLRGINVNFMAEVGKLGSLSLDGNGTLSGSQAVNTGGFLNVNVPLTGTYSVEANGRGQALISDGTFEEHYTIYVVDSSRVYLLYTGSEAALFGAIVSQF